VGDGLNARGREQSFEWLRVAIERGVEPGSATSFAASASRLMSAAGTGVSVAGEGRRGLVPSTVLASGVAVAAEAAEATLGEGPGFTVRRTGRPVVVPDLDDPGIWVLFGHTAAQLGIRAVFSVPLLSGTGALGAISFYRSFPGDLTPREWDDARTLAVLALELLTGVAGLDQDQVLLAGEPEASAINQAIGMVGVQLDVDMGGALALLQARAVGAGLTLAEVARSVLAGDLRFSEGR
jgi:hypothetical protein